MVLRLRYCVHADGDSEHPFAFASPGLFRGRYEQIPEPGPPAIERDVPEAPSSATVLRWMAPSALTEWTYHKTGDNLHPDGNEQQMVWLMNRARSDPRRKASGWPRRTTRTLQPRGRIGASTSRSFKTSSRPFPPNRRSPSTCALQRGQGPLGLSDQHGHPEPIPAVRSHRCGWIRIHFGRRHRLCILRSHGLWPCRFQHRLGSGDRRHPGPSRAPQRHHVGQRQLHECGLCRRRRIQFRHPGRPTGDHGQPLLRHELRGPLQPLSGRHRLGRQQRQRAV